HGADGRAGPAASGGAARADCDAARLAGEGRPVLAPSSLPPGWRPRGAARPVTAPASALSAAAVQGAWNCRLTTTGRKSGLPRSVTLWFVPEGDRVYLAGGEAAPQWCRNLRVNPAVELTIAGHTLRGRAQVVDDPARAAAIRDRFAARYLLARLSRLF